MQYLKPATVFIVLCSAAIFIAGCTFNSSSDPDMTARQDKALRQPFDSSPGHDIPDDISGGDIGNLDPKAWNRDVDHVLNP